MDSSISTKVKVGIVLGYERVRLSDLTLEAMVYIFRETIASVKPAIKYLPGFAPIGELLNCQIEALGYRRTALSTTKFSDGISVRTKVTKIGTMLKNAEKIGHCVDLLLTDQGDLVIWTADYRLLEREVEGGPRAIDWEATSSKFELVASEKIEQRLWGVDLARTLLLEAITKISRLSSTGLIEREGRLRSIRDIEERTRLVLQNIITE